MCCIFIIVIDMCVAIYWALLLLVVVVALLLLTHTNLILTYKQKTFNIGNFPLFYITLCHTFAAVEYMTLLKNYQTFASSRNEVYFSKKGYLHDVLCARLTKSCITFK